MKKKKIKSFEGQEYIKKKKKSNQDTEGFKHQKIRSVGSSKNKVQQQEK